MYGTVCASLLIKYPFLADYDGTGVSSNGFIDVHTFYIFLLEHFAAVKHLLFTLLNITLR
jgi:hypothetical protein